MNYSKYPIVKTLDQCILHLEKGGELWQKLSFEIDRSNYSQIDNYYELIDLVDYEEDVKEWEIHLVK